MTNRLRFTLPQAAIVLGIVGLVFGIFASLVGQMREASQRVRCANNLRQISIGAYHWLDVYGSFPPLTGDGAERSSSNELQSAFQLLTPFLEAHPMLYRPGKSAPDRYHGHSSVPFRYKHKDNSDGVEHGGVANQTRHTFIDPADYSTAPLRDIPVTMPDGSIGYYATGNYVINGLLPFGKRNVPDKYLDTSSNLILFAERPRVCVRDDGETVYNLWGLGGYSPHMAAFGALAPNEPPGPQSTEQFAPVLPLPGEGEAIQLRIGRVEGSIAEGDFERPIRRFRGSPCDPRLPIGLHRGGMQVAMADGSVRMFTPETSAWVFWSACVPPNFD